MRLPLFVFVGAFTTACVTNETPVVSACRTTDGSGSASSGALTALPSLLGGVTITKAAWRTHASTPDGVPTQYLIYSATLHADRKVEQGEIALIYDAPGAHTVVDNAFFNEGADQFQLSNSAPLMDAGAERTVSRMVQLRSSYRIGRASTLQYCPSTVRVVPRSILALELAPGLRTAEGQVALLRRVLGKDVSSLVVVMDTVVSDSPGSTLLVGAALNTTDSTLTDMVVALVPTRTPGTETVDTLEYLVGDVPAHAVVPFAGGWLNDGERIVGRTAYRSTVVKDRPIAGDVHQHRVSEAGRASRDRAVWRAHCAAWPDNCAK